MAETRNDNPFTILADGSSSRAETLELWDKWGQEGKVKQVKPFDEEKGFGVWQDQSGRYFRVNFQAQSQGNISTNEPKATFANIVSLSEDEIRDVLA